MCQEYSVVDVVEKGFVSASVFAMFRVQKRLSSADGMDLAELLYQTMQAYDFAHLYNTKSVNTQIGGSDQWGNIMSGVDLIKRTNSKLELGEPIGITTPLFSIGGKKMGKSENNAIWLSASRTAHLIFSTTSILFPMMRHAS